MHKLPFDCRSEEDIKIQAKNIVAGEGCPVD
jgi:hypothetical protein